MKRKSARLLAALLVLALALAGCTGSDKPDGGSDGDGGGGSATDKQEITLNLGEEPPNLDSALATDTVSFDVLNNVMEGLIRTGKDFEPLPGMAKDWEIDGVHYTFHLREDARWSDGKPVTAHDFKYAWLRALDPRTASQYAYQLYYIEGAEAFNSADPEEVDAAQLEELRDKVAIETPDDHTLKVTLTAPTPYWLGLMSFPTYLPQRQDIVEQHGDKYASSADTLVYNGPFIMEEWVHEDRIILKKNPNYWDADSVKLEKVTWLMIKDSATAIGMYEVGDLDRVGIPGDYIEQYRDKGLQTMAEAVTFYLVFNLEKPVFHNKKLRQAFNLALDRQGFADKVLKNGSVPAEGYVPSSMAGAGSKTFRDISGTLIDVDGDREKARQLWEQAKQELGIDSLTVKLLGGDSDVAKKLSQGLQQMLQDALPGLTVELDPVAFNVRLQRTRDGDFDIVFAGWGADYNDPMTFMNMFVTGGPYNDARWSNQEHDRLIEVAETSTDQSERIEAMAAAEKIMMEELPILPLYHRAANWVQRDYLKGVLEFPLGASIDLKHAYVEGKTQ